VIRRVVVVISMVMAHGVGHAQVLDAIAARVDKGVITWSQVLQEIHLRRLEGESDARLQPGTVLDSLIRGRLLFAEAEKLRLNVDPREVSALVEATASSSGADEFWEQVNAMGLTQTEVLERSRQRMLVKSYLELRREMTFVPDTEIRAFHVHNSDTFGGRPLSEVREEVRAYLAEEKYREELEQWIDRQIAEGRVHRTALTGERWSN
jgi:hypothetical protein